MKFKINQKFQKGRQIFLFFPQFCHNCHEGRWLEMAWKPAGRICLADCPICGKMMSGQRKVLKNQDY